VLANCGRDDGRGERPGYILVGIMLQERDLVRYIGPEYEAHRRRVPTLIPTGSRRG
jgi:protein-S-isoprenylcysteine O-methyltransferase Ste14